MTAIRSGIALGIVFLVTIPVLAHHPFSAEYDWKKPVSVTGVVMKLEWTNPHAYLHVGVEDTNGRSLENWVFEMGSLNALQKAGWRKDTVKMGDSVTVDGWLARSKANTANMKSVWLANGRELSGASAIGNAEPHEKIAPKTSN